MGELHLYDGASPGPSQLETGCESGTTTQATNERRSPAAEGVCARITIRRAREACMCMTAPEGVRWGEGRAGPQAGRVPSFSCCAPLPLPWQSLPPIRVRCPRRLSKANHSASPELRGTATLIAVRRLPDPSREGGDTRLEYSIAKTKARWGSAVAMGRVGTWLCSIDSWPCLGFCWFLGTLVDTKTGLFFHW
jgi:hypothetical protein